MDADRFDVESADGTRIAVWTAGSGPPMVLVHGAISDHSVDVDFAAELSQRLSTFAVDRRGRGASADHPDYSIEREFEDIAAVVDAVADRSSGPVTLWGHSYGADCAMGAATLTANIRWLVLYEPGFGMTYPAGSVAAVESALVRGDLEGAAVALLREVVEMTEEEVEYLRTLPTWSGRLAHLPTAPRELNAESAWIYRPGQFSSVTATTLLLAGSESPASQTEATERAAAAIPGARIRVLDGHGHIAHRTNPAAVAEIVADFIT